MKIQFFQVSWQQHSTVATFNNTSWVYIYGNYSKNTSHHNETKDNYTKFSNAKIRNIISLQSCSLTTPIFIKGRTDDTNFTPPTLFLPMQSQEVAFPSSSWFAILCSCCCSKIQVRQYQSRGIDAVFQLFQRCPLPSYGLHCSSPHWQMHELTGIFTCSLAVSCLGTPQSNDR